MSEESPGFREFEGWRQLTLYDREGKVVLEMPIGPRRCGWTADPGRPPLEVVRVEVSEPIAD